MTFSSPRPRDAFDRPLRAGLPVSSAGRVGTLGGFAFDRATRMPCALSSHHVLMEPRGHLRVWQPSPCGEPACDCSAIGHVLRGRRSIVQWRDHWFYLDAAVIQLDSDVEWTPSVTGVSPAVVGMRVSKHGAATGFTEGVVIETTHVDRVNLGGLSLEVPNQVLVRPLPAYGRFAARGDSGALVCNEAGHAVSMLWGADDSGRGVSSPIGPVLDHLGVTFDLEAA